MNEISKTEEGTVAAAGAVAVAGVEAGGRRKEEGGRKKEEKKEEKVEFPSRVVRSRASNFQSKTPS